MNAETQKDHFDVINRDIQQQNQRQLQPPQQQQPQQRNGHMFILQFILSTEHHKRIHKLIAIDTVFGHIQHRYQEILIMINDSVHVMVDSRETARALVQVNELN